MKFDTLIKAVFALAAIVAAGTYAYDRFVQRADTALAAGVDGRDGWEVSSFLNAQGGLIIVTRYAEDPLEPTVKRHTMTVYELRKQGGEGEAKLLYVGSRVLDYDQGLPLMKFKESDEKDYSPNSLKEIMEKAGKGKRR
jgi:hypothetical protein